jgi:hypothetical integral membrane protein (TIGR02206 family)
MHDYTIPIFSTEWFLSAGITFLLIILILVLAKKVSSTLQNHFAKVLGAFLLLTILIGHFYLIATNKWGITHSLPLHLCGISAILSGVVLLKKHQLAYECLFFWGIPGATHSLLTPELTQGGNGFLYPEYFISHGGILLAALYLTIVVGMKPRKLSWWKIFIYAQFLAIFIGGINFLIGANYMYLCHPPIANNPLVIGDWPWYILVFEAAAIVHFLLIYSPFWWHYKKANSNSETTNS